MHEFSFPVRCLRAAILVGTLWSCCSSVPMKDLCSLFDAWRTVRIPCWRSALWMACRCCSRLSELELYMLKNSILLGGLFMANLLWRGIGFSSLGWKRNAWLFLRETVKMQYLNKQEIAFMSKENFKWEISERRANKKLRSKKFWPLSHIVGRYVTNFSCCLEKKKLHLKLNNSCIH